MKLGLFSLGILFVCLPFVSLAKSRTQVCDHVFIESDENFNFTKNDKVFICGDESSSVWTDIPQNQKKFHIGGVLQKSGYYSPRFTQEGENLIVYPGEATEIGQIRYLGEPEAFDASIKRKANEGLLTDSQLNKLQAWTMSQLQSMGFPCAQVSTRASSETGEVIVEIHSGPRLHISEVERPEDPYKEIYKRFDAFEVGDLFNQDLLLLTSRRIVLADLAQYAHFEVECTPAGAHLKQKAVLGEPRLFTFSIGSSTEEAVISKIQWKHTRLDKQASTMKAEASYTPRLQQFTTNAQLYLIPDWVYTYFLPEIQVTRESEKSYKTVQRKFGTLVGHIEDNQQARYFLKAGPYYNHLSTLLGEGPRRSTYISWEAQAKIVSHYYEYYQAQPQKGYFLDLYYKSQREGLASELSVDQFQFSGSYLVNYRNYDPPLHIIGLRFATTGTLVSENQIPLLPQDYRVHLGGDKNIRGFSRKSINNAGKGYINSAYLGFEWRFAEVLPYNLQPFVLVDAAKVGENPFTLDETLYWSPGVGLRWQSPIGSFRLTAARGYIEDPSEVAESLKEEWVFFLSYGSEF